MTGKQPPIKLTQTIDKINKELTGLRLEPYIADDEWGDEWRVQVVSTSPEFVMRNLLPEYLISWHLFYLIGLLATGMREQGVRAGLDLAHQRVIDMFGRAIRERP